MKVPSALLRTLVTIEPYEGHSATGPVFGPEVSVRARIDGRRRAVRTSSGVDVIASSTAIIRPGVTVPAESRVTDPAGQTFTVLDVAPSVALTGPALVELILDGPR